MGDSKVKNQKNSFTLRNNQTGQTFELPIMESSIGPNVIDVRNLYSDSSYFTFDPGFTSTGSCESGITFIDGDRGVLLYRGYAINELATSSDFPEVCYLLLYGNLPNLEEKTRFNRNITA